MAIKWIQGESITLDELYKQICTPQTVRKARCPKPATEYRSKLEQEYASILDSRLHAGELVLWKYEPLTLKLAKLTTYTPDFFLLYPDGHIELHETKGFMRDDANVKIKVAASMYPFFTFILVQKVRKQWQFKEYPHQ